jgi:hypothetical protein
MKRQPRTWKAFPRGIDRRAFTNRRTPKDVDGRRFDVPCVVLGQVLYGTPRKVSRKWYKVRFADGKLEDRHMGNLDANRRELRADGSWSPGIPFVGSHGTPSGWWWLSGTGALERVASLHEKARHEVGDPASGESWVLVSPDVAAGIIARRKTLPNALQPGEGETDRAERARKTAALRERREARAEHARKMLAMHERALRREEKLVAKWRKLKARADRFLDQGKNDARTDES